jgi:sugar lactone lactonase YvrE
MTLQRCAALALALALGGTRAACPGGAAPGFYCAGSVETACNAGAFCAGGGAGNASCMVPSLCDAGGLSAEPPCLWSVSTLAGNGSAAPFADGAGALATFSGPAGVAAARAAAGGGAVFVADRGNHKIRRVAPAGAVSTLAGSGMPAFADGTGASAGFFNPTAVAAHPLSGDLYCADYSNHRIRRVTLAGVASTFAGSGTPAWADGAGASSSFKNPAGLVFDAAGVLYVADQVNHRIRKVTPLGAVSTLAGNGNAAPFSDGVGTSTATFNNPCGVEVDGLGNVLVADVVNNRIRRITPVGVVTTFVGSGAAAWTDGVGTAAAFSAPRHLALQANGNLLVGDSGNSCLRAVTPAGVVSTLAGGATPGFLDGFGAVARLSGVWGVAVDANGTVHVGDSANNRIRRLDCAPCPAGFFCPPGTLYPQPCPGGHFCPLGTASWARQGCGRGAYCPRGSAAPLPCPALVPPGGGAWAGTPQRFQGPAFMVETASCLNHCFWNFSAGASGGLLSQC